MKRIKQIAFMILAIGLITGCGCEQKEKQEEVKEEKPLYDKDASVVKDQIFKGLEFVNTKIEGEEITTAIINNTGVVYEPSTFTIKVKDKNNNTIVEIKENIESAIANGETRTVVTNANTDLSSAYSIEYSVD